MIPPTFHFIEIQQDNDRTRQEALRENASRPAVVEIIVLSTGLGQVRVTTPLVFPIPFRNEPHFTSGSAVVTNSQPNAWHDPVGQCGIRSWSLDERGLYVGAYIWTRVTAEALPTDSGTPSTGDPIMKVQHFLTFSGTSFKDLANTRNSTRTLAKSLAARRTSLL